MTQRFSLGSGIGYSKSYPELTKQDEIFDPSDATQISFGYKRKFVHRNDEMKLEFTDVKAEYAEMRKQMTDLQFQMREMMTCLIANNNKQVENFNKLYDNISGVKEQLNNIQYATDGVVEEQFNIQWELYIYYYYYYYINFNCITENKVALLETSLQQIISNTPKTPSSTLNYGV